MRPAPTPGDGEHLLYVDDDAVTVTVAGTLRRYRCRVTELHSAADAVAAVRARPQDFDLVATDDNMPGVSGVDLRRESSLLREEGGDGGAGAAAGL